MTRKPEWHDKIPKALLREWDAKLKDSGFYDIEAGVGRDGHMLKGSTPSFRLITATGQGKRPFDEMADADHEKYDYQSGDKAEYYRLAERCCVRLAHTLTPEELYCWCLHSIGMGERQIQDLLGYSRPRIRDNIKPLREEIKRLTSTPVVGYVGEHGKEDTKG